MTSNITLYTIGFASKRAENFFGLLKKHHIETVIDVRLKNTSQLAGYTKKEDLEYFLKAIGNIRYNHRVDLAPTDELMESYKLKRLAPQEFEEEFIKLLTSRKPEDSISPQLLNNACLLCAEKKPEQCHRSFVAKYFKKIYSDLVIVNL